MSELRDGCTDDPWMRTVSGDKFFYKSTDGDQYNIDCAAAALSRLCRYSGHISDKYIDDIYSVAQHSVYVYRLLKLVGAPVQTLPWAIAHDVPEAYFNDLTSPLKSMLPDYVALESASAAGMRARFNIPFTKEVEEYVGWADLHVYYAERLVLTTIPLGEHDLAPPPSKTLHEIDPNFYPWRPEYARRQFKEAFIEAFTTYRSTRYADTH